MLSTLKYKVIILCLLQEYGPGLETGNPVCLGEVMSLFVYILLL